MSAGAAGDGLIRGLFEGCISAGDMGIQRRPYHKNCKCALHKDRGAHCTHSAGRHNVSYPMRRTWSDSCLALMSAPSSPTSPRPSSPTVAAAGSDLTRAQSYLSLCKEGDEEEPEDDEEDGHGHVSFLSYKV